MENQYWLNKWQSNDIAFHEKNINPDLIAYIQMLNLHRGDYIFVPLCGKTKDMLWLANEGFYVIGVELSPIACSEFFSEMNISPQITKQSKFTRYKHKNMELLCGNVFDLTSTDLPTIHAVYDCKALIALPPDDRKRYANHIISCFGTKTKILLLTIETSCKINPPPYSVDSTEVSLLYGDYFNIQQLKCVSVRDISEHLIKKGYLEMKESVYFLSETTIVSEQMKSCNIIFKKITEDDLTLLHRWFQIPHVLRWYARGEKYTFEMIQEKYLARISDTTIPSFIIYEHDKPIGYIQYYHVTNHLPEGIIDYNHPLFNDFKPNEIAGIDLFIADESYLGNGFSSKVLIKFINTHIKDRFKAVLVDPSKNNHVAIKFFEKNGFQHILSQDDRHDLMINKIIGGI